MMIFVTHLQMKEGITTLKLRACWYVTFKRHFFVKGGFAHGMVD